MSKGRLALSLAKGESLLLGNEIKITLSSKNRSTFARLTIEAPKSTNIKREKKNEKKFP